MSLKRLREVQPVIGRAAGKDPVVVVRQALEQAEKGHPLFLGQDEQTREAIAVLEERLKRLKSRGIEFGDVELSVYARSLHAHAGRMTMAS
jgi:hypothetical protein